MAKKKQAELAGFEAPSIPALDEMIGEYLGAKEEHALSRQAESDARSAVQELMKQEKQETYRYVDGEAVYELKLTDVEKLKCKRISEPAEEPAE